MVLTKLDMMVAGTMHWRCRRRHRQAGYVGVVTGARSTTEASDGVAHADEKQYRTSPDYMHIAKKMGTSYLARR